MLFGSSLGIGRIRRLLEGVVNLNKNGQITESPAATSCSCGCEWVARCTAATGELSAENPWALTGPKRVRGKSQPSPDSPNTLGIGVCHMPFLDLTIMKLDQWPIQEMPASCMESHSFGELLKWGLPLSQRLSVTHHHTLTTAGNAWSS